MGAFIRFNLLTISYLLSFVLDSLNLNLDIRVKKILNLMPCYIINDFNLFIFEQILVY